MTEAMPLSLAKDGKFWFLRHVHNNVMRRNKHFALLVCGESGSGKSWDSASIAQALFPAFKPKDSFAFSPIQFLSITEINHPKLFPAIMDDAGLTAFSGDALTSQVKNISKIAQSIRYKNWQIILNLPNIDLLAKSVRITNHYYLEPHWIDYANRTAYVKFQRLKIKKDKIVHRNLITNTKFFNKVTGYNHIQPTKHLNHAIPAPSKEIIDEYEHLKDEFMTHYRRETAEIMRIQKAKELGKDVNRAAKAADYMRNHLEEFTNAKGRADVPKIIAEFQIGQNSAHLAYKMAMMPKTEQDVVKGQKIYKEAQKKGVNWYTGTKV
jgi:hypothetical protein